MTSNFSPEPTAENIRSKSFLKQRSKNATHLDTARATVGSHFFKDNKIRSCSYVK